MEANYKLKSAVIEVSRSKEWGSAVQEWEIEDCVEDDFLDESCVCGKENLRYLFTIVNLKNSNRLFPIGSTCIKKFERKDLSEKAKIKEQLFKLLHAIERKEFIELTSKYFSKKFLLYLYEEDAFLPNQYNYYNSKNSYDFMLKMFNKRNNSTNNEQKKINAILVNDILPYLRRILTYKIKRIKN